MRFGQYGEDGRRDRIADKLQRHVTNLTRQLRIRAGECGQIARIIAEGNDQRKRRDDDEVGFEIGDGVGKEDFEKDYNKIWGVLAKWTRNSMHNDCPEKAWPLYARLDRLRWTYMRHYCEFVNTDCEYQWARYHDNGEERPRNFRGEKWFEKKYGSANNPPEFNLL